MVESLNIDISKFLENSTAEDIARRYSANVLMKILTEGLHSDITLGAACGRSVRAHRCVLAGASRVFQAMFKHEMKEQTTSTVEISDMSMEALQLFLLLLYMSAANEAGSMTAPEFEAAVGKHSLELLQASQKYDVEERLNGILARALFRVLTCDNCWDYCRITSVLLKSANTLDSLVWSRAGELPSIQCRGRPDPVCVKYITHNFPEVVKNRSTLLEMERTPELVWTFNKVVVRILWHFQMSLQNSCAHIASKHGRS